MNANQSLKVFNSFIVKIAAVDYSRTDSNLIKIKLNLYT